LIKIAIVILFIISSFAYVEPDNWTPFMPMCFEGVIAGAATVFVAYLVFDAIANASEEVKNPQKAIPIGIIGALGVCTILFIGVSFV
ncbi:amino acid permease, partial [Bacillus pumilus]